MPSEPVGCNSCRETQCKYTLTESFCEAYRHEYFKLLVWGSLLGNSVNYKVLYGNLKSAFRGSKCKESLTLPLWFITIECSVY